MRRISSSTLARCSAVIMPVRAAHDEPRSPEVIREILNKAEKEQMDRELAVDSRNVVFSSGASADNRPRVAAAEAFDLAAAALPRPPNFCYMNVSLDFSAMIDAPEVIWFNLCRSNDTTPSTVKPQSLHMIGGAVSQQRLGGGYIQVILGHIPDLQVDPFTFDAIPEKEELHGASKPPPAACIAMLDANLSVQYERVLSGHLNTLSERLGPGCPVVGGLYPPMQPSAGGGSSDEERGLSDSVFFINDRVYTGSAAAVILRSRMLKATSFSVVPSISLGTAIVDDVEEENGVFTIKSLGGVPATEAIKNVYLSDDLKDSPSKVFLGIADGDVQVPISFIGNPEKGVIQCAPPAGLRLQRGDTINFLVDNAELDGEAAAGLLIAEEKVLSPISVEKDITVAREARRSIIASNTAALHFSYPGLNVAARPDLPIINLGTSSVIFAPPILQRCVGRTCPSSGFFSPGQVATIGNKTGIFARSSTYCFLRGLS